jgi:hypothetical protein
MMGSYHTNAWASASSIRGTLYASLKQNTFGQKGHYGQDIPFETLWGEYETLPIKHNVATNPNGSAAIAILFFSVDDEHMSS